MSSRSESTAVELPWFCPRCERTVLDSEVSDDCLHAPCGHEAVLRRDLSSVEYHQPGLHSFNVPDPVVPAIARMCVEPLTDGWPEGLTCRRDDDAAWEVLLRWVAREDGSSLEKDGQGLGRYLPEGHDGRSHAAKGSSLAGESRARARQLCSLQVHPGALLRRLLGAGGPVAPVP